MKHFGDRSELFSSLLEDQSMVTPFLGAEALEDELFLSSEPLETLVQPEEEWVPLSPMQLLYFESNASNPYDHVACLQLEKTLTPGQIEVLYQRLWDRHDALRAGFSLTRKGWALKQDQARPPLRVLNVSCFDGEQRREQMLETAREMSAEMELARGALVRMAWFYGVRPEDNCLIFMVHRYMIDPASWKIVLQELKLMAADLVAGRPHKLPPITTTNEIWCKRVAAFAQSETIFSELNYWCGETRCGGNDLPVDFPRYRASNTLASLETLSLTLAPELTADLFDQLSFADGLNVQDVLMTALNLALSRWMKNGTVLVDIHQNGRGFLFEGMNPSRTVGCLETRFPVRLTLSTTRPLADVLPWVAGKLDKVPRRGIGYDLLRGMVRHYGVRARLHVLPEAEISFRYRESDVAEPVSGVSELQLEHVGTAAETTTVRHYLLEHEVVFDGRSLSLNWRYSRDIHRSSTINKLAQDTMIALTTMIHEGLFLA